MIASHVLEHSREPDRFLEELSRVGKAGYIETPNAVFERLNPYNVHLLEIMDVEGRLLVRKKSAPVDDNYFASFRLPQQNAKWRRFFYSHPEYFHVCHRWRDRVDFELVNPEEYCNWYAEEDAGSTGSVVDDYPTRSVRGVALQLLRRWYGRRQRPTGGLRRILVCPGCRGELGDAEAALTCPACRVWYPTTPWHDFIHPRRLS